MLALVSGCQFWPHTRTEPSNSGWDHDNLYNARTPYAKLFVEIDAVDGQGPTPAELKALEAFLQQHCDKPGGITVRVDDLIPRHKVVGRSTESVAMEFLGGAPPADSAFLYVLFYNSKLRGAGSLSENPAFSHQPHPIIWIDRSYRMFGNPYGSTFARAVLLHETGHALGLCAVNNHHGAEGHCTNASCLMYSSIAFNVRRFLTLRNPWKNTALCRECAEDLAQNKFRPASNRVDFWQGFYRRREDGYQVLGLPGLVYVHFGDAMTTPSEELLQTRREAITGMTRGEYTLWATVETFDPWEHLEAFRRFCREEDPTLQGLARSLLDNILAKLEESAEADPDGALRALSDELILCAAGHSEQHARLLALREDLYSPPGYGAQLTRASSRPANLD